MSLWVLAVLSIVLAVGQLRADSMAEALKAERYEDAVRMSEELLKTNPASAPVWTARGFALEQLGRNNESIESFETALRYEPGSRRALMGAAEASYRARDKRAQQFLTRLIRADPENGVAHAMAGVLAYEAGDCGLAIQHFEAGRRDISRNEQASTLYGVCLLKKQRAREAVAVFERLLAQETAPKGETLNLLAKAEISNGQPQAAADHLRKAVEIESGEERNYVDLAALCIEYDKWDAARQIVDLGLEHLPTAPRLHALRGVMEAQSGRYENAELEFERANDLDPKEDYGAAGLGALYNERNRPDEAIATLRARLHASPDDPTLNYLLAEALVRVASNDPRALDEARQALADAVRVKPDFARALALQGKLDVQSEHYETAVEELQAALRYDATNRAALNQLAIALRRMGRSEDAAATLAKLRKLIMNDLKNQDKAEPHSIVATRQ